MTTLNISNLTCEYRVNPIGLDTTLPRFTWQLSSDIHYTMQSAYQIQVSMDENSFEPSRLVWDSGHVQSEQSVLVVYEGPELLARKRYFYRVKVWDQSGLPSPWSEIAFWEMGQLSPDDWSALWITPDAAFI
ncbi:alpha-L-rhamnosidase, partial [Paenibacillus sp. TAF58]